MKLLVVLVAALAGCGDDGKPAAVDAPPPIDAPLDAGYYTCTGWAGGPIKCDSRCPDNEADLGANSGAQPCTVHYPNLPTVARQCLAPNMLEDESGCCLRAESGPQEVLFLACER